MRVNMEVKYFDKNKKLISDFDHLTERVWFKFVLKYCPRVLGRGIENTYEFQNEEYGEILSESDFYEIKKGRIYNHSWVNTTWGYDCSNNSLFIHNQPIEI